KLHAAISPIGSLRCATLHKFVAVSRKACHNYGKKIYFRSLGGTRRMASVTYRHVYKRYSPEVTVINDLSIEIPDGEFLVFVGPSGCGKSTSLRMLAGLEEVTDGEILIGDRVVNNVAPKDRDIAMVFQSYALYPH